MPTRTKEKLNDVTRNSIAGAWARGRAHPRGHGQTEAQGNTKGESITVLLTSCLTGLELVV
jgi:hypothetical protein